MHSKRMNSKVERLLNVMALILKDEKPELIKKLDEAIKDKISGDGYPFNFIAACHSCKNLVKGV